MENDDLLTFSTDIGEHRCTASLIAAPGGNNHLAVLLLSHPPWSNIAEWREYQAWKLAALAWAQQLTGTTPLVVEPDHGSAPPRRRHGCG